MPAGGLGPALLGAALIALAGCEEQGPAERTGERLDEAAEELREGFQDAREEVEEAVEDARDATDEQQ